jgi:hypothetical protein
MATTERLKPLFVIGPAGSGKSRYIKQLADREGRTLLHCPCRKDRTLREQRAIIHEWALRAEPTLLWLEGADDLTPEAQSFLRRILETYAQRVRFCLEARSLESIQEPILSRCNIMRMKQHTCSELAGMIGKQYSPSVIEEVKKYTTQPSHRQYSMAAAAICNFPELWSQKKTGADAQSAVLKEAAPVEKLYLTAINPWEFIWKKFTNLDTYTQSLVVYTNVYAGNPWAIIHYISAKEAAARCGKDTPEETP